MYFYCWTGHYYLTMNPLNKLTALTIIVIQCDSTICVRPESVNPVTLTIPVPVQLSPQAVHVSVVVHFIDTLSSAIQNISTFGDTYQSHWEIHKKKYSL